MHTDDAATRAVNVRDQKKRDGHNKRQDEKQDASRSKAARTIADHQIAEDGDYCHQEPCLPRHAVSPGGMGVSLRFNTSFIPETVRLVTRVGCANARAVTAAHKSVSS